MLAREKSQREEGSQRVEERGRRRGRCHPKEAEKRQETSKDGVRKSGTRSGHVEMRKSQERGYEKLSGLWNKEPSESSLWMGRQRPPSGSNLRRAMPMNQSNDQIAQGSEDLWGMARAKA